MTVPIINWKTTIALLLTANLWFLPSSLSAQAPKVCGTDILLEQKMSTPEGRKAQEEFDEQVRIWIAENGNRKTAAATYIIPTVVHIVQESTTDMIPDACVLSQIAILNQDFQKLNSDTGVAGPFFSLVADCEIEFCLATLDPQGNQTTGITRTVDATLANHSMSNSAALKGAIQWDPAKYFNIWVPKQISGGILGYATFPGGSASEDGVVVNGDYFGDATCSLAPYNLGRTATHEVGHWLGLYHTFQDGCAGTSPTTCATQGDLVCDTPPTSGPNFGCPASQNTCTQTPPSSDGPDQTMNYMDYGDDNCIVMFTPGQKDRMHATLNGVRANMVSQANHSATGCGCSAQSPCAPVASFQADNTIICAGQTVNFTDQTAGPASSWAWTFTGGTPASSTMQNPAVTYTTPGTYNVELIATNSLGSNTMTSTAYIQVVSGVAPPVAEGFEVAIPADWQITNADGQATWQITTVGSASSQSVYMDNWVYDATGTSDGIQTNIIDLTSYAMGELTFDYSYKQSFPQTDSMAVYLSSDCGETWNLEWKEGGSNLATVGGVGQFAWVPAIESDWLTVNLDLVNYVGASGFKARFDNIGYEGNNLYLDNVNISAAVGRAEPGQGPLWSMDIRPNPSTSSMTVNYQLPVKTDLSFKLMDINGRLIFQKDLPKQAPGNHSLAFPDDLMEQLEAGIYFLRGESDLGYLVKKVVRID